MAIERWQALSVFDERDLDVKSLWVRIADLLPRNRVIKLVADGEWSGLRVGDTCKPESFLDLSLPADQLILPDSPAGALLGKVGGSTAGRKDGTIFAIGTFCVLAPLEKAVPLFVAVNGAWRVEQFRFTRLKIEISIAEP